jgi:hypothetical protein
METTFPETGANCNTIHSKKDEMEPMEESIQFNSKKRPLRRGSVWPVRTMSEAALTLSTAPTESVMQSRSVYSRVSRNGIGDFLPPGRGLVGWLVLTALFDRCACFRKLDKDDVAEALLSIVRDGHRSDTGLVVILDHLVILRV